MPKTHKALAAVVVLAAAAHAKDKIAYIEFFGYQGIDVEAVRSALPLHEGDAMPPGATAAVRAAVKRITGSDATDVAPVCCINDGDTVLFIGLAGKSNRPFALNPRPMQDLALSAEALTLVRIMEDAEDEAKDQSEVDKSPGYRLMKDERARATELNVRKYALAHTAELMRILANSARSDYRETAADILGYADRSPEQIDALVDAAHDPDSNVRNNAARALGEILEADAAAIPMVRPTPFVDMLRSGTWTDRNKSSWVLVHLTEARDVAVLANLKARSWEALIEMARWRVTSWNTAPRLILARIAGIPEERARELTRATPAAFLQAIGLQ